MLQTLADGTIPRETYPEHEMRVETFFCDLAEQAARRADAARLVVAQPRGAVLFVEGQRARGVYVLAAGRVKLSASSGEARVVITDIAEPGDVLGLSAVISGRPYEVTAEALDNCRLYFIRREEFLRLLDGDARASLHAARQLSRQYHTSHRQVRLLGLSASAAAKLARLILECAARYGRTVERGLQLKLVLTHEEIGQLIGASRETVTRLLSDFKRKKIIQINGATLLVRNLAALEALARP